MAVRTPILAIRPVVSDKALALQLCRRVPTKLESSETSKVFVKGGKKKNTVYVDRHMGRLRELLSHALMAV